MRLCRHRLCIPLAAGTASLLMMILAPSCTQDPPVPRIVGSFAYTNPARSFILDPRPVRFLGTKDDAPSIRSITPNLDQRFNSGNRLSFVHDRNFGLEITIDSIPPNCFFRTGFALAMEDAGKAVSAEYEIWLNDKRMASRTIDSFALTEERIWYDERFDLKHVTGQAAVIRLSARVSPPGAAIVRGWSEPCLMVTRDIPWTAVGPEAPNIIVVLVDTLRADHLSCYDYRRKTSPRLDAFARRSILFEYAIAPSSWTWPSTASVLTGQYPLHHGVLDGRRCTLALEKNTLAEVCVEKGMHTGAFIANALISSKKNFDQGFVTFRYLPHAGARSLVDAFEEWLDEVEGGRFMAYLHFMDPHSPYNPPDRFLARFSDPEDPLHVPESEFGKIRGQINAGKRKPSPKDRRIVERSEERYDAEILFWDQHFGRILDLLEAKGLSAKTVVAVTSDHGEAFLENDVIGHGFHLYDTCLRVPLILGGPHLDPKRIPEQVELISIMPTLLDVANIASEDLIFDGRSLMAGEGTMKNPMAFAHTETAIGKKPKSGEVPLFAVRSKGWKLLYNVEEDEHSLFHLTNDPEENIDLASDNRHAGVRSQLKHALDVWIEHYEALSTQIEFEIDEETRQILEQLGYMGK